MASYLRYIQHGLNLAADFIKAMEGDQLDKGVVCRGVRGDFKEAWFKKIQWVASPLVVEALAIREGLHFAWGSGYRSIEIESDSKKLINMLRGTIGITMEVEVLVTVITPLASYLEVKFQYVKRSIHNEAHCVTYWDQRGALEGEWVTTPPCWLNTALLHDFYVGFLFYRLCISSCLY
ncbi:hypothetical protein LIER_03229 [Lithospermum erythrorhizon]|uniref:RNase H type-1 domain-containing protein n=1 Tax=Lithospermum erythrorhizon TaxID=34254 RepID=A0AAV3NSE4_LITER